uniref:Uncharacterized protein n=1 Tax=Zea mays TaxID=4577 RepID=C4J8C7_MAIZE|nr:unknown [Zea mays]
MFRKLATTLQIICSKDYATMAPELYSSDSVRTVGFSCLPSVHLEMEKWTFSRDAASDLKGSLRQFRTSAAQMLE